MAFTDLFRIKKFKKEIEDLKEHIETQREELKLLDIKLHDVNKKNTQLEQVIENYKKSVKKRPGKKLKYKTINTDDFYTTDYKNRFESFMQNATCTDEMLLDKFNEFKDMEYSYFEGIATCINFIRIKRNRKMSFEKQILKNMLTENGRTSVDSIIEDMAIDG